MKVGFRIQILELIRKRHLLAIF